MSKEVTRKEVAEHFGVSTQSVKSWEKKGLIKPEYHLNGKPRYSKEAIEAMKKKSN